MAPSFCCRVLGNADGERFLGAGDHQEGAVVGSYLFCYAYGVRLSSRPHRNPCAVETCSPPSDGPQSLWDFALRVVNPAIWWRRRVLPPRPTHIIVNIWGDFAPTTTISLQADQSPGELVDGGGTHIKQCVLPTSKG